MMISPEYCERYASLAPCGKPVNTPFITIILRKVNSMTRIIRNVLQRFARLICLTARKKPTRSEVSQNVLNCVANFGFGIAIISIAKNRDNDDIIRRI
jgi:hypothetical protein